MYSKLILTDCDGVLLNWEYAFDVWMNERGHKKLDNDSYSVGTRYGVGEDHGRECIKLFNESAAIGFLPPLRDAMYYIKKIHEELGYVFRVITSLSTNPYAVKLRERNLEKLFGTAIDSVVCLETGADKDDALLPYEDSGITWIEDKVTNAEVGYTLGLSSILIEHGHNMKHDNPDIPIVKGWRDIYEMVRDK